MPSRNREIHFPVTAAEERYLLAWARQHERAVSSQVRWYLRDVLSGAELKTSPQFERAEADTDTAATAA